MSDQQQNDDASQSQEDQGDDSRQPKTFDAEYVEKLRREAAKYRTEAKDNAAAAKRLAEIEDAQKTAEQKAAERLAEIEQRAAQLAAKEARASVAEETGVPAAILAGPEDSTPEAIRAYADLLVKHMEAAGKPRTPRPDLNQGRTGSGKTTTSEQFAAAIDGLL